MKQRTGLRNRYRNGRGSYSKNGKSRNADYYGEYLNGKQIVPDKIAGKVSVQSR